MPTRNRYSWAIEAPPNGINDSGNFSINNVTGQLSFTTAFNYETLVADPADRRHGIPGKVFARTFVRLSDDGQPSITQEIWIEVLDANEAPGSVAVAGVQSITENTIGVVANNIVSGDPDTPLRNSYAWSLVGPPNGIDDNGHFTINGGTGQISVTTPFDYETLSVDAASRRNSTASQIFARVYYRLVDGALPAITKDVWIEVTDVNEAPTGISAGVSPFLNENSSEPIVTCTALGDRDAAGINQYVWSLIPATDGGIDDGAEFTIDWRNGSLSVANGIVFDYEALRRTTHFNVLTGLVTLRVRLSLKDGNLSPVTTYVTLEVKDVDEPPVISGWNDGTTLADPNVSLRVGDDPSFSVSDPDAFDARYLLNDELRVQIDLTHSTNGNDELSIAADQLSQLTITGNDRDFTALWPEPTAPAGVLAPAQIAILRIENNNGSRNRIVIRFQIPDGANNAPVAHVDTAMITQVLRTIMYSNKDRSYARRTDTPTVEISFPPSNDPTYARIIDLAHTNTPPVLSAASSLPSVQRGNRLLLNHEVMSAIDDHADLLGQLVIDALPTAGTLVRSGSTVPVVVGDIFPLSNFLLLANGTAQGLECLNLEYAPLTTNSATSDSFICHVTDGGVLVGVIPKFRRSSPLTRINLTIIEAAIPRFALPLTPIASTYNEGSGVNLAMGSGLSWAQSATSFGNWRLVVNGVGSAALGVTGLDPHDVLSFAGGGVVTITGTSLSVGSVLIGTVVAGYGGLGKPLAIDFTDMVGLPDALLPANVVLDLVQHLQFRSTSRIMTEGPGISRPLFVGFVARRGVSSSFISVPLTWMGIPDAPVWGAAARVVMATAQTVSGTLACVDPDSGTDSPVDPRSVAFTSLDAANGLSLGQAVVTQSGDGWHYLVPWTWTWSGATGATGATGGVFRVRAANVSAGNVTSGFADTSVTIAVTGDGDATLSFVSDAPMGLLATGTAGNWHIDLDQRLRVRDQLGNALGADQLQYALGGSPPPGTTIDPATGTLQIHYSETTTTPTPFYRFTVLVNSVAITATANGILPVALVIGSTPSGSN